MAHQLFGGLAESLLGIVFDELGFFGYATHFHDGSLLERRLSVADCRTCGHARVFLSCYSCNAAEG
jgi:hypothetical protein